MPLAERWVWAGQGCGGGIGQEQGAGLTRDWLRMGGGGYDAGSGLDEGKGDTETELAESKGPD